MNLSIEFLVLSGMLAFLFTLLMHLTRKNTTLVGLYLLQSLTLVVFLGVISFLGNDTLPLIPALLTLFVKVIFAPYFFFRLIKGSKEYFTSKTYLGIPLSLLVILGLSVFLSTRTLPAFGGVSEYGIFPIGYTPFYLLGMFLSIFLIVNHKDMLAQMIGMLSLENWIVFASAFVGFKHSLVLELGITVDIVLWILIATIFAAMLQRSHGSMNVADLTHLKEQ